MCINLPEVPFRRPENGYFSLWFMPHISKEKNRFLTLNLFNMLNLGNALILEDTLFQDHFLLGYDAACMRIRIPTFGE
jgi:hypothetical protein